MARPDSTPPSADQQPDSDNAPIPRQEVEDWLDEVLDYGSYFQVRRNLYRILSKLDTLFLSDLLNVRRFSQKDGEGWFLCTNRWMQSKGWTVNEQKPRWASLCETGLVRIERRGIPTLRWVYIDRIETMRRVEAAPDDPDGLDMFDPDLPDAPDDQSSTKTTTTRRPPKPSTSLPSTRQRRSPVAVNDVDAIKEKTYRSFPEESKKEEGGTRPPSAGQTPPDDSDSKQTQSPASAAPCAPNPNNEAPPARSVGGVLPDYLNETPAEQARRRARANGWDDDDTDSYTPYEYKPRQMPAVAAPSSDQTPKPINPGLARNGPPAQSQKPITPATPPRRPAPEPPEDESGALFPSTATKTTRQDADRAARLRTHVVDMKWRPSGTRNDWGPELGILRREREKAGDAPDRIDRVLDEYITKRINKPTIKSGKELRAQWDWVLQSTGMDKPAPPEVTPKAQKIADRVLSRNWPFADDEVRVLTQKSMDAIDSFWDRLDAFPKAIVPQTGRPSGLFTALTGLLGELQFQTEKHLMDVAENLANWSGGYRGGTDSLVWAPDKHLFAQDAGRVCRDWQWPGGWPALLKAINDNWVAKGGK